MGGTRSFVKSTHIRKEIPVLEQVQRLTVQRLTVHCRDFVRLLQHPQLPSPTAE